MEEEDNILNFIENLDDNLKSSKKEKTLTLFDRPTFFEYIINLVNRTDFNQEDAFKIDAMFVIIYNSYSTRKYHNLEHITLMLNLMEKIEKLHILHSYEMKIAILFHDLFYSPYSYSCKIENLNELSSMCQMVDFLIEMKCPLDKINKCKTLLLSTIHNPEYEKENPRETKDEKIIHDLDIIQFMFNQKEFDIVQQNVRDEFHFIDDKTFYASNSKFLEYLLNKDHIYESSPFIKFEEKAKTNIENELKRRKDFNLI